jgi:hypothetical protein
MIESNFQVDELIHTKGLEYGHPRRFMRQLSKVWSGVLDVDISPQQASTMLVLFKAIRLYNNPNKVDTQDDIQGYLKIIDILNDFE